MADASADLIVERPEGLYCPPGDFYIDPCGWWRGPSSPMPLPTTPGAATAPIWSLQSAPVRGARRHQGLDRSFVLSDHADWPGLQRAIAATAPPATAS